MNRPTFFVVEMTDRRFDIIRRVEDLAEAPLADEGLELVEAQYRREGNGWVLRLFIDRSADETFEPDDAQPRPPGSGVTLDDCVAVSREIGRLLDVEDIIPGGFTLEVSSPGLDRPLTRPEHYIRFAGRKVKVRQAGPEGRRKVTGRLLGLVDGEIKLNMNDREESIPYNQAERVTLVPEVDWTRG